MPARFALILNVFNVLPDFSSILCSPYCSDKGVKQVLIVESSLSGLGEKGSAATAGVNPLWEETSLRLRRWWGERAAARGFEGLDYAGVAPIVTATGFVASTADGAPTTLKRSGWLAPHARGTDRPQHAADGSCL